MVERGALKGKVMSSMLEEEKRRRGEEEKKRRGEEEKRRRGEEEKRRRGEEEKSNSGFSKVSAVVLVFVSNLSAHALRGRPRDQVKLTVNSNMAD